MVELVYTSPMQGSLIAFKRFDSENRLDSYINTGSSPVVISYYGGIV